MQSLIRLIFIFVEIGISLESIKISSDGESYLDDKKVTNYNSKMQKISNEDLEVPRMKSNTDLFHQKYDKLDTILITERDGKAKLEQSERTQTMKGIYSVINFTRLII